ncbi:MAG: hypothetical protein WC412_06115 [Candidatus Omnitrophota bacterium]|jgi:type II secretory pathway component GspD/PulD (secretin)
MKKIILMILALLLIPLSVSFSQDNIYGDYLLGGTQKLISLDLEGAKLIDTLKMLSQQTGLNFVSTEAVKERTLTLYLEKVPLKEAMDIIFKANNLTYEYYPDANMFVVKEMGKPTIELKTKVYHLQYVRIQSARMQTEITDIMQTDSMGDSLTSGSSTSSSSTSSSSTSTSGTTVTDVGIKYAIQKVLTEFGKISEDPITNSLIVIDVPSQFEVIDSVMSQLDVPSPKVLIEVEMLDVTKGLIDQIGFKYGDSTFGNNFSAVYNGPNKQVAFPMQPYGGTAGRTFSYGTFDMGTFNMVVQALSSDSSTKVLARPKILTLSNETAEINLTTDEAIGINTTTTETGVQTSSTERTKTGTKLRVTPQVNKATGEITLFLEVFTRDATDSELTLTGDVQGSIKNPEERGTKSVLRLNSGETLLMGGLIRNKSVKTVSKIPVLGDIPWLGKLFSFKDDNRSERELLVFLTPKIINDAPQLAKSIKIPYREQDNSRKELMSVAMDRFSY